MFIQKQTPLPPPPNGIVLGPTRVDGRRAEFTLFTNEVEEIELSDEIQEVQLNWILINHE